MPDSPDFATGGLIPGPQPGDPPFLHEFDPCMLGQLIADAAPEKEFAFRLLGDPNRTFIAHPDGTWTLSIRRSKQHEEESDG